MKKENLEILLEIQDRVEEMHKAAAMISTLWQENEEVGTVLIKNYPFNKCFNELSQDITRWSNRVISETAKLNKSEEYTNMIELIRLFELENYSLEINYECPQWDIVINDEWHLQNNPDGSVTIYEKGFTDYVWSINAKGVDRVLAEVRKLVG